MGTIFLWKEYERDTIFCQKWSLKGWGIGSRGRALPYKTLLSSPRTKLRTACFYSKSCSIGHRAAASFNINKQLEKDIHPSFIITSSCLFGSIYDSYFANQSIWLQIWMHASLMQMFSKQILLRPTIFTDSRFLTPETIREWVQAYGATISGIVWEDKR